MPPIENLALPQHPSHTMIHYACLLSFGDNVISLSLLSQITNQGGVTIIGTELTRQIAGLFPDLGIPVSVEMDRVPAFYDVRKRGPGAAIGDAIAIHGKLRHRIRRGDSIIVEQPGLRSRVILGFGGTKLLAPTRRDNVYEDRKELLESVFDQPIALEPAPTIGRELRSVAINPASRIRRKAIPPTTLEQLVDYFNDRRIDVTLLDPNHEYAALQSRVAAYCTGTTLQEAAALIRQSDLYVGPDSLMIHLAYHYRTPAIVLFNETNLYFAPPGIAARRMYLEHVSTRPAKNLQQSLSELLASVA